MFLFYYECRLHIIIVVWHMLSYSPANTYDTVCESVSAVELLVCDYILNDICVIGVYESLWPSAIPVFMSYTITHPCFGKVL